MSDLSTGVVVIAVLARVGKEKRSHASEKCRLALTLR